MKTHQVAVIRGDGIGPELVDAALSVLDAVTAAAGFRLDTVEVDGGADTYRRTGAALSARDLALLRDRVDATLKGPVGLPDVRNPDGTEAGLLGGIMRGGLDVYANVRPILLLPGVRSRLRAEPGSIDYVIVRENTEGLYASRGKGVGNKWAVSDTLITTREGCLRVCRYAFDLALRRRGAPEDGGRRVTCVDKSNVLRSYALFREVFEEVSAEYPSVRAECLYVDAAAQALVLRPEHFDVLVMENFLGDILSDLGGGTVGGISMCPAGNVGDSCAYFEPIHGSAPSIAGAGKANPIGQILAAGLMLDYLGHADEAGWVRQAVGRALAAGDIRLATDGSALDGTGAVADAVAAHVRSCAGDRRLPGAQPGPGAAAATPGHRVSGCGVVRPTTVPMVHRGPAHQPKGSRHE